MAPTDVDESTKGKRPLTASSSLMSDVPMSFGYLALLGVLAMVFSPNGSVRKPEKQDGFEDKESNPKVSSNTISRTLSTHTSPLRKKRKTISGSYGRHGYHHLLWFPRRRGAGCTTDGRQGRTRRFPVSPGSLSAPKAKTPGFFCHTSWRWVGNQITTHAKAWTGPSP